jgi:DNA-binding FadR family transcriptional regulator
VNEPRTLNLHAVRPRRLSDDIVRQVEDLILNEELRVGDALPPERELAAQLEVSRNILREAISMLVQKGLLEVRPGSGTFVARPSAEFLRDSLDFFVRFHDTGLHDLIEARYALEVQIADLAAQRASEEALQFIDDCLRELELTVGDPERYIEADVCFHSALAQAAQNGILQLLLTSIRGALRQNIRVLLGHHPTAVEDAMRSHRLIARAVREHSAERARAAMQEHLGDVKRQLEELDAGAYE